MWCISIKLVIVHSATHFGGLAAFVKLSTFNIAAFNTLDLFPKSRIENIWLPCRLYEYYPLRISLDYTLYKIRWKRYPAEKSANQSTLELQLWKTSLFGFFRIGDILFIYLVILNADMSFENGGWFFFHFKSSDYVVRII